MADIDFLNKKQGDDELVESKISPKPNKGPDLIWSKPDAKAEKTKSAPFSLLPFLKNKLMGQGESALDQKKIKESRQEILRLIKSQEAPRPPLISRPAGLGLIARFKEKFARRPSRKEVLIDYQKVFAEEKNKRTGTAPIAKPAAEPKPERPLAPEIKAAKAEPKAERIVEPVARPAAEPKKVEKIISEPTPQVLETNLIKGAVVSYFDWQKRVMTLVGAFFIPIFLVGLFYLGLTVYQKQSQTKNLALVKKFNELTSRVKQEEVGTEQIFNFKSELKVVDEVFNQHIYWTNFFRFLEDNTIKDIYFTGFVGDTSGNYSLTAMANNYNNIAEQIKVLRNNKKVTAVEATGGEIVAGDQINPAKVKFTLKFSVAKSIFTE